MTELSYSLTVFFKMVKTSPCPLRRGIRMVKWSSSIPLWREKGKWPSSIPLWRGCRGRLNGK